MGTLWGCCSGSSRFCFGDSVLGIWAKRRITKPYYTENQDIPTLVTTLEDGSVVFLAKETSIRYPEHFVSDKREVSLQGDAFFDVAKNRERPFWIDTEQVKIEVLGTAFSVKSVEDAPFRLSVQRGTVRVTLKKGIRNAMSKLVRQWY